MPGPSVIVVPFGIPETAEGLGLGAAGLVHELVRVGGSRVALGQFHANRPGRGDGKRLMEAMMSPAAWRDIVANGNAPSDVPLVITGAIEPPEEGDGALTLHAFDGRNGEDRGRVERTFEEGDVGKAFADAVDELLAAIGGGDSKEFRGVEQLSWEPLVNLLRAERCMIGDPVMDRKVDRNAALLYLERAIVDAPTSDFVANRLAMLALDTMFLGKGAMSAKSFATAGRALSRAAEDSPGTPGLIEALALVESRQGDVDSALSRLRELEARWPTRPTAYALLAQLFLQRGEKEEARSAIERGLLLLPKEPSLLTEKGNLLVSDGAVDQGVGSYRAALRASPHFVPAFHQAASIAMGRPDIALADDLVDIVLGSKDPPYEMVREAITLAFRAEVDGIARAARIAHLGRTALSLVPLDVWVASITVRALNSLGETREAKGVLAGLLLAAAGTAALPEVLRLKMAVEEPELARELEEILKRARTAPLGNLSSVASAARSLAIGHRVWWAWHAVALADMRLEKWASARSALEEAMKLAPTAVSIHVDLVTVLQALGAADAAVLHAERALALEGPAAPALARLAHAQLTAGRTEAARATISELVEHHPSSDEARSVVERLAAQKGRSSWIDRLKSTFSA